MEDETKVALLCEMMKHKYDAYDTNALFEIYTTFEIKSYDDLLKKDALDFVAFLLENRRYIDMSVLHATDEEDVIRKFRNELWRYRKLLLPLSYHYELFKKQQYLYVRCVNEIVPSGGKILDIGAGKIPVSSIMLASNKEPLSVMAMDEVMLSKDCAHNLKIDFKRQYFDDNTDVSDYGVIATNRGCGTYPDIARQSSRSNKACFMTLCGCGTLNDDYHNWINALKEIDPKINFSTSGECASNILSTRDMDLIIEDSEKVLNLG